MARPAKFTEDQKYEIVLDLLSGKYTHGEVCRKWGVSPTYAYKLRDRALEILRRGIGKPVGKPDGETEELWKRVADLEQLAGDQALAIRSLKKRRDKGSCVGGAVRIECEYPSSGPCVRRGCIERGPVGGVGHQAKRHIRGLQGQRIRNQGRPRLRICPISRNDTDRNFRGLIHSL